MDPRFRQPATVSKKEETHSGEDVGVYASGPFSHVSFQFTALMSNYSDKVLLDLQWSL